MQILLINPPNCGRSIPEERYGITSVRQIFRGEPLALEELAGNLTAHDVRILDLKAEPDGLDRALNQGLPDLVGLTGVTCEANTVRRLAGEFKAAGVKNVVVGGIHASNDPAFFNHEEIDYICIGLGKLSFRELVEALEQGRQPADIPGIAKTSPGGQLQWLERDYREDDLVSHRPPAYQLVASYRDHYRLERLKVTMGFVVSAAGCPHRCSFCCIKGQCGGRYLTRPEQEVIRDIELLADIPVIRLIDANTFGNPEQARRLGEAIRAARLNKQFLADVRSDTVVNHPELMQLWREAGLRAVIIGFEELDDRRLTAMNKANRAAINREAVGVLQELGITIVGDFIVSPGYHEEDFQRLSDYLAASRIDLPIITVLTPLPGTAYHRQQRNEIINHDLDYYTLTNAVTPTRLAEEEFYRLYAELVRNSHQQAKL
ncbi:B12-binding domain-containing radical SAM protein [Desulfurivibrio alkaliphilus]|uniref:Radical SAM domain protein n=1 Tax=Desulfurivibrio alkaliphilus (strain DSM 19089 / UNIQEM U267 / AHT2) TaxID=589865 RepID=D6Z2R1_DESAT|nr:radical SAM protein [Desulfurivibrio alkaliphilus]ADH85836.1 Radical SAM domain protein [Desulfurivibrio alkaliphilus AHT 2]